MSSRIHNLAVKKRGRPSAQNKINFSPQPRSFVSKLLMELMEDETSEKIDHKFNKFTNTSEVKLNSQCLTIEEVFLVEDYTDELCVENSDSFINLDTTHLNNKMLNCQQKNQTSELSVIKKNYMIKYLASVVSRRWLLQPRPNKRKVLPVSNKKKEISCLVCFHRSYNAKQHKEHMNEHKNNDLYFCNYPECPYTSKLSCNLIKHKRIHTSEKPYFCDQCLFRSNFINSLKAHRRTHTNDRPYACNYCSYRCNSNSNLRKHKRCKHADLQPVK